MNMVMADFSAVRPRATEEKTKQMLSVQKDGAQTLVKINASSLSTLLTCGRKSKYQLHDGLKSRVEGPALTYGKAIHKALEIFYSIDRSSRRETGMPEDFDAMIDLMAHGHEAPSDHPLYGAIKGFLDIGSSLACLPDTEARSLSSGVWVLSHYFKTYANDSYVICNDPSGNPYTERTCETLLFEDKQLRINLFGTVDVILRDEVTGIILPGDHKTTSQLGRDFFNRLRPNHQYTGYLKLARECLGIESDKFLVNGIQSKARPLTSRGGPPLLTRQITQRNAQDFIEYEQTVVWAVRAYLEWSNNKVWPLGDVNACSMYGACSYLDICSTSNELRSNIIEANYV